MILSTIFRIRKFFILRNFASVHFIFIFNHLISNKVEAFSDVDDSRVGTRETANKREPTNQAFFRHLARTSPRGIFAVNFRRTCCSPPPPPPPPVVYEIAIPPRCN